MDSKLYNLVGDEFELGYRHQDLWGWEIAFAFFFGEVGTGFFFFSAIYGFTAGMVLGWIMAAICKPIALFMHLGQPKRFWRAIMGLRHSWISRGVFFTIFFTGFGFIYMINHIWPFLSQGLTSFVFMVTMVSCVGVMIYLGFVLSYSPAIPLWNSGIMPILSVLYGCLGGTTLVLLFGYHTFLTPEQAQTVKIIELVLVCFTFVSLLSFLHGATYVGAAGNKSVKLLLKEKFAPWFIPAVVIVGILMSAMLMYYGSVSVVVLLIIAIAELIGDIGLKILLFKAGTFEPVLSHSRF